MVEMGGIEPPSNKPLLSRSFRKPKFAHNNMEDLNTDGTQCGILCVQLAAMVMV